MKAIDDILRKYTEKTVGLNTFGAGTRSYANIADTDEDTFPRIWRHKISIIDTPNAHNKIHSTYNVVFDICNRCSHDASSEDINQVFDALEPMYVNFINAVLRDDDIDQSENISIQREPLIHDLDQNLVGWMVFMKVKVKQKTVLQCPRP